MLDDELAGLRGILRVHARGYQKYEGTKFRAHDVAKLYRLRDAVAYFDFPINFLSSPITSIMKSNNSP